MTADTSGPAEGQEGALERARTDVSAEPWNLTAYCWRLEERRPGALRLNVFCARGWAGDLAKRFRARGIEGARARRSSCVVADRPGAILALARHLAPPGEFLGALERWAGLCPPPPQPGEALPREVSTERAALARRVLELGPQRGARE
jgi:hypothetical protein